MTIAESTRIPARRLPAEQRRQLLVAAARSVIAEKGLHATTMRDVAASGGVALGTVTYHFAGIGEVLAGVLEAEMNSYSAPIAAAATAADSGRQALSTLVSGLLADGPEPTAHWRLWLDFWTLAAHDARYASWQADIYRQLHEFTETCWVRGVTDGSLTTTDPRIRALSLIALIDGLVVQCYLPGAPLTPAQARDIATGYLG